MIYSRHYPQVTTLSRALPNPIVIVVFNQPCTLALFCARVWFWGVTWCIHISIVSTCIIIFLCSIDSYLQPLPYNTKIVWWGAILRNRVLECCQFAPSITRSILIVSLRFNMHWKVLSILLLTICDTACLMLLSEITLHPLKRTTWAAPLATPLLLPTITIYLEHRCSGKCCSWSLPVFSEASHPQVCVSREKQASFPELVDVDRIIILIAWTYWMSKQSTNIL